MDQNSFILLIRYILANITTALSPSSSPSSLCISIFDQVEYAASIVYPTRTLRKSFKISEDSKLLPQQDSTEGTMFASPTFKFLDFIFGIEVVHDIMFGIYRKQIVAKSEKMGLPWKQLMIAQQDDLDILKKNAESITNPAVSIPDYYYAPIHAYKEGNLCWASAMEEDLWSKLMIGTT